MIPLLVALLALASGGAGAAPKPLTRDLYVVSSKGGPSRALTNRPAAHPSVSPDGRTVAFASGGIKLMNPDGSGTSSAPQSRAWPQAH